MIETETDRLKLLAEFGAGITLPDATEIKGIVDRDFVAAALGDIGIGSTGPQALVSAAQIAGKLSEGSVVTVANSGITGVDGSYKIKEQQPDGTGLVLLTLKESA